MTYMVLSLIIVVASILLTLLAVKLLIKSTWLLGWLRGTSGIIILALVISLAFVAMDFLSYKQWEKNQPIATLNFVKLSPQYFKVSLVDADGIEKSFELTGDMWQLDARLLKWHSSLARIGMLPGYRLDRLSGRYVSLEDETNLPRSVYSLFDDDERVDVWSLIRKYGGRLSIVESVYGSATYLPMTDGALFSVMLTPSGLSALPLNDRAVQAVDAWK